MSKHPWLIPVYASVVTYSFYAVLGAYFYFGK